LGGSNIENLLKEKIETGIVLAGTSAGAAMMSSSMITGGPNDVAPCTGCVEIAPGLDLINGTVIDTHFAQRGRHGRLMTAIAHYPQILGIGLDEQTAIVMSGNNFEVIGNGSVTIMDGRKMKHTDLVSTGKGEPIGLFDVCVHVLPQGYSFDLEARKPSAAASKRSAGASV
jgi:cyanophycinase